MSAVVTYQNCDYYNSMKLSPYGETKNFSASPEISCILWNQKVHYYVHDSPPFVPVLSRIIPKHALSSHYLRSSLILFSQICLGLPNVLFRSCSGK